MRLGEPALLTKNIGGLAPEILFVICLYITTSYITKGFYTSDLLRNSIYPIILFLDMFKILILDIYDLQI